MTYTISLNELITYFLLDLWSTCQKELNMNRLKS
jgi:hypothetical protein